MTQITSNDTFAEWITQYNSLDSDFRTGGLTRTSISVADTGGLGGLSYNSVTGIITYTGASDSDVRNLFSVGSGLTYDSATGQFDATVVNNASETVLGIASFDSDAFTVTAGHVSLDALTITTSQIATDAVTAAKLSNLTTLVVYNSAGSAVKTLYGAGS